MSGKWWAAGLALAVLSAAQTRQPPQPRAPRPPSRKGFARALAGSVPVLNGKLRVIAPCPVVVRGGSAHGSASYSLKGGDDSGYNVQVNSGGPWSVLAVQSLGELPEGAALEISVPKPLVDLIVNTRMGAVEAYDIDGTVQLGTGGGRVQVDRIGMNAMLQTVGGPVRVGTVRGTLRCVSGGGIIRVDRVGGEAWLDTAGGDIYIAEAGGPVHAGTAGNIQVGRARSSVAARADGGIIEVNQAGGLVTAQTSGGAIQVGPSKGIQCESAAGAIRVTGVGGPMRAFTASGSILAEVLGGARLENSSLNAARGDVTVFIPSNVAVSVKAMLQGAAGRRIVSEFPEIRVLEDRSRRGLTYAEGALNGGGPVLQISAAGTIYLRRQR